jgi:hypothetical protein
LPCLAFAGRAINSHTAWKIESNTFNRLGRKAYSKQSYHQGRPDLKGPQHSALPSQVMHCHDLYGSRPKEQPGQSRSSSLLMPQSGNKKYKINANIVVYTKSISGIEPYTASPTLTETYRCSNDMAVSAVLRHRDLGYIACIGLSF